MGITEIVSGIIIAIIGGLGFLAKHFKSQRDNAVKRAESAEKEVESQTELANTQSALNTAQHDAREKTNEELSKAGETTGTGRDFSRDRMHDYRNKN